MSDSSPRSALFHPALFKAALLLAGLFVLSAWGFAGGGISDIALAVVTYVFLVAAGLVSALALTRRRHPRPDLDEGPKPNDPFDLWADREVEISTGPMRGRIATVETLLPIAAVAVGMVAFALVLHFAGHA
ncbi:MAG: hypothetical protein JOY64_16605 [Alphaproteobacteria bacterium]|nr:hypothetical protein [Alphaproteobacteria bacterium]MBV8409254.1 hypothetical protein [Alphaproteobacteria bacterium]